MIKAILFDFAGVIVTEGYWLWLKETVSNIEEKKGYFQKLSEKGDAGVISQDEYLRLLSEGTGVAPYDIYPQIRKKIQVDGDLLRLITRLRKNYKVGLITNYTYGLFDMLSKELNLPRSFDKILVSSRVGLLKPDPKFYQLMFDALKVTPQEAVYVDDRDYQVKGAEQLGMKALLYTNGESLITQLTHLGIAT